MKKKILAVALVATMALATTITGFAETLTGTAWWTGKQDGKDYTMSGDGTYSFTVKCTAGEGPALSVEAYDAGTDAANDGYFFTTGSDGNGWFAELAKTTDATVSCPFADNGNAAAGSLTVGDTYTVTITRSGSKFTVSYYDETKSAKLFNDIVGTSSAMPKELKLHFMAQVGTFEITEKKADATTTDATTIANHVNKYNTK